MLFYDVRTVLFRGIVKPAVLGVVVVSVVLAFGLGLLILIYWG